MRPEKAPIVDDIQKLISDSPYLIVTDYGGLKVDQFAELRNRLYNVQAEFHVVKNNFVRIAMEKAEMPSLESDLKGQTAIVYGEADIAAAAKVLKTFHKEFEMPKIRSGVLDNSVLTGEQVNAIAELPPKEVLLAKLLGLLNAPATKLARLINTPGSQLAQVLKANSEKGE